VDFKVWQRPQTPKINLPSNLIYGNIFLIQSLIRQKPKSTHLSGFIIKRARPATGSILKTKQER
jgi:hypothetical protein